MPPSDPDLRHEDEDGAPEWDDDWAKWLLGQYALVGITRYDADGTTICSHEQYHGRVVDVARSGVTVACEGVHEGQSVTVPPDQYAFQPARPGQYRLKSTEEIVDDPDVLSSWNIYPPAPSGS